MCFTWRLTVSETLKGKNPLKHLGHRTMSSRKLEELKNLKYHGSVDNDESFSWRVRRDSVSAFYRLLQSSQFYLFQRRKCLFGKEMWNSLLSRETWTLIGSLLSSGKYMQFHFQDTVFTEQPQSPEKIIFDKKRHPF